MTKEKGIPPPPERMRENRLTDEMRSMQPGESILLDARAAHALKASADYWGWVTRRQTQGGGMIRVWRIA